MLFYGPAGSAKGSAALELARSLCCTGGGLLNEEERKKQAQWKCSCSSCERHRILSHDDLLALGNRPFESEINACKFAFIRNPENQTAKLLFYRSVRKLLIRFSPVLAEDDPKMAKSSTLLQSLDEKLNEFYAAFFSLSLNKESAQEAAAAKLCDSIVKDALALGNDALGSLIPVSHIRSASRWCHIAPNGKYRILIIENAENMRDEARNSLLKLLEEPPENVRIVLTAKRREAVMPTILSRLRPYRFLNRSAEKEKEIIRRVFLDAEYVKNKDAQGSLLNAYLDSFLVHNAEKLRQLAVWFMVSFARIAAAGVKKSGGKIPMIINAIGQRYAKTADESGYGRLLSSAPVIKTVCANLDAGSDSFSRFLKICLELAGSAAKSVQADSQSLEFGHAVIAFNDIFRKCFNEVALSSDILNINMTTALEGLFYKLETEVKRGANG